MSTPVPTAAQPLPVVPLADASSSGTTPFIQNAAHQAPFPLVETASEAASSSTKSKPPSGKPKPPSNAQSLTPSRMHRFVDPCFVRPNLARLDETIRLTGDLYEGFLRNDMRADFRLRIRQAFALNLEIQTAKELRPYDPTVPVENRAPVTLPYALILAIGAFKNYTFEKGSMPVVVDRAWLLDQLAQRPAPHPDWRLLTARDIAEFKGMWDQYVTLIMKSSQVKPDSWVQDSSSSHSLLHTGVWRRRRGGVATYGAVANVELSRTNELLAAFLRFRRFRERARGNWQPDVTLLDARVAVTLGSTWASATAVLDFEFVYEFLQAQYRRS